MGKIELLLGFVLMPILIVVAMGFVVSDLTTNYVDTGVSNATVFNQTYAEDINKINELNNTFSPLISKLSEIGETDPTLLEALFQGGAVFIQAVLAFPKAVFLLLSSLISIYTLTLTDTLQVPPELILIGTVGITILAIIVMMNWTRRYEA